MQKRSKRQLQVMAAKNATRFAVVEEQGVSTRCGISRTTYMQAADAGEPLLNWAASLVERNMRTLYETSPGWHWDAAKTLRSLQHEDTRLMVCWDASSTPVAFAAVRFETAEVLPKDGWAIYIYELQVEHSVRRRGVGSHLLALLVAIAAQTGATMIRLTCFTANASALAFYTRNGFIPDPISPAPGEAAHLILRKKL